MALDWTIPIATFLLGQLSLIAIEWFRHRLTRKQQRDDASDDFQRSTLLELQDTMDELAVDAATVFVLREKVFRLPLQRKDVRHDNPHAQAVVRAAVRLPTLAERIYDGEVRTLIGQLDAALREAIASQQAKETTEAIERFRALRLQANEQVGILLRSL